MTTNKELKKKVKLAQRLTIEAEEFLYKRALRHKNELAGLPDKVLLHMFVMQFLGRVNGFLHRDASEYQMNKFMAASLREFAEVLEESAKESEQAAEAESGVPAGVKVN